MPEDLVALRRDLRRSQDLLDSLLRQGMTCLHTDGGRAYAVCGICPYGSRGERASERNRVCRGVAHIANIHLQIARLEGHHELAKAIIEDMGLVEPEARS